MVRKALLIGINYKGSKYPLNGCINDVDNVRRYLDERHKLEDVTLHDKCDKSDVVHVLTLTDDKTGDSYAGRQNILKAFAWLAKGAKSGDQLMVHYSGHGSQARDYNGDEKDGLDETLCPADYASAGMILDDDIRSILINPLPQGCQLRCIFDCCHSGTMTDTRYVYKHVSSLFHGSQLSATLDTAQSETKADVIAWSGCRDDQTSADAYIEGKYAGALTASFLRLLRDGSQSKKYQDLYEQLEADLKKGGYSQRPQLTTGKPIDLNAQFDLF